MKTPDSVSRLRQKASVEAELWKKKVDILEAILLISTDESYNLLIKEQLSFCWKEYLNCLETQSKLGKLTKKQVLAGWGQKFGRKAK